MKSEEWLKQRKWTVANGCLVSFTYGLSVTGYSPTEYYYFKDTMKVRNPQFFFGLGYAFLCGSAVVSSLAGSYYVDKTKNVRQVLLLSSVINLLGNILYLLHYSPFIVLFGQLLVGIAAVRGPVVIGEVARVYESEEMTGKLSLLALWVDC